MEEEINIKLERLNYLMEEIKELSLHCRDLREENYLLAHDFKTIKPALAVDKIILCIDYFK